MARRRATTSWAARAPQRASGAQPETFATAKAKVHAPGDGAALRRGSDAASCALPPQERPTLVSTMTAPLRTRARSDGSHAGAPRARPLAIAAATLPAPPGAGDAAAARRTAGAAVGEGGAKRRSAGAHAAVAAGRSETPTATSHDRSALFVELGLRDGVSVGVCVSEPVAEALTEAVDVQDAERVGDGVTERVTDGVGSFDRVTEGDGELLADCDRVSVCDDVRL